MPLITSQGFDLVPDISPLTQQIGQALQQRAKIEREDELIARKTALLKGQQAAKTAGAQALRVRNIKDFTSQRKEIAILAQNAIKRGEDPQQFVEMLNIQNPDELNLGLTRIATAAANADKLIEQGLGVSAERPIQFGAQQTFKDSEGNLFFGTTKRSPTTGQVESVLAPVRGGDQSPVGKVSLVSGLGQTAAEKMQTTIDIAKEKEAAKLEKQLQFKPQIEKAVVAARKEATERGDVLTDLNRMTAALPGLTKAVNQLRDLSTIATSTFGGKLFDTAVKETGFGSTKGATARAKFIAIVNNQVLPLLKPTFGAAFTVPEGDALRATMGDPDATPEQKMAQLDAFIAQKKRDVETKQLQLRQPTEAQQAIPEEAAPEVIPTGRTATNPQTGAKVQEMSDGTWRAM